MRYTDFKIKTALFLILCFLLSIGGGAVETYAKTAPPKISYKLTKAGEKGNSIKINLTISDKQDIKAVKYAEGYHRSPFFKYSFYSKKVKNMKLSSTKKLAFQLTAKPGSKLTVYAENKKGMVSRKLILAELKEEGRGGSTSNGGASSEVKTENKVENKTENKTENASGTKSDTGQTLPPKTEDTVTKGAVTPEKDTKNDGNTSNNDTSNNTSETPKKKRFTSKDGPNPDKFNIDNERRSVWVSFLEYSKKGATEQQFRTWTKDLLDDMEERNLNTIYFHVRPFSDAMYQSNYYPWSVYASGKEGKDPGYDPLKIIVKEAHDRNIKLHAYINPYRVNYVHKIEELDNSDDDYKWLNPAYRWMNDSDESNDRNVLKNDTLYWYNPSKPDVRKMITNGVKEICERYDVDGIVFDDYFYPNLGKDYKKNFDAEEYEEYVFDLEGSGKRPLDIISWRRENVDKLIKSIYKTVKGVGKNQEFGISPAGNISNLRSGYAHYINIDLWGSKEGYVDYLEPQQYWGFDNKIVPFAENVARWKKLVSNPNVKLYIALPIYRLEDQPSIEWKENVDLLGAMLQNLRLQDVEGFSIFRYDFMKDKYLKKKAAREGRDIFFDLIR